ncbi:MAG TPA: SCE4755 family polysaccharide monooxygenase-like protein [Myxococcaceae bacterium]|nr:SCE4755 family polysaccharide monooxygenase-like protein [Myxococcaceae bacterium]
MSFSSFGRRATALAPLLLAAQALAHAHLTEPRPRDDQSYKTGPCGNAPRGNAPQVYRPGERVTVSWTETVAHPGYYQVWFSAADDANFTLLADQIPNPAGITATQSAEVTLPSIECAACTLRLIQVMQESEPPTNYFSCADISLQPPPPLDPGTPRPDAGTPPPSPPPPSPPPPSGPNGGGTGEHAGHSHGGAEVVTGGCGAAEGALSLGGWGWTLVGLLSRRRRR